MKFAVFIMVNKMIYKKQSNPGSFKKFFRMQTGTVFERRYLADIHTVCKFKTKRPNTSEVEDRE